STFGQMPARFLPFRNSSNKLILPVPAFRIISCVPLGHHRISVQPTWRYRISQILLFHHNGPGRERPPVTKLCSSCGTNTDDDRVLCVWPVTLSLLISFFRFLG